MVKRRAAQLSDRFQFDRDLHIFSFFVSSDRPIGCSFVRSRSRQLKQINGQWLIEMSWSRRNHWWFSQIVRRSWTTTSRGNHHHRLCQWERRVGKKKEQLLNRTTDFQVFQRIVHKWRSVKPDKRLNRCQEKLTWRFFNRSSSLHWISTELIQVWCQRFSKSLAKWHGTFSACSS